MESTQNEELSNNTSSIKVFLNTTNECLSYLREIGYDTNNLYLIYDTLREELSNNNIEMNNYINSLNHYTIILKDLLEKLKENINLKKQTDSTIEEFNHYINNWYAKPRYQNGNVDLVEEIKKIIVLAVSIIGLTFSVKLGKAFYKDVSYVPEQIEYMFDTEGNENHESHYYKNGPESDSINIIEYLPADEAGFRIMRTYELPINAKDLDIEELLHKIDLTNFETINEEIIYDKDINSITTDYYKVYKQISINNNSTAFPEDIISNETRSILIASIGVGLILSIGSILIPNVITDFYWDYNSFELFEDTYNYLTELIRYKHRIRKECNGLKLAKEEQDKYEKVIDSLCKEIDNNINNIVKTLSFNEEYKKQKIVNKAKEKEEELSELHKKEELFKSINEIIITLTSEISKFNSKEDYSAILHSIPIDESILFESDSDHYKIRDIFLPILKFLDLSLINFRDVDIRNIDFSETNATINIQTVYNKDLSNSSFNNRNIPDWSDYKDVNISGTRLEELPETMLNLDFAIKNNETEIKLIRKPYRV